MPTDRDSSPDASRPAFTPTRRDFVLMGSAAMIGLAAPKLFAEQVVVIPGTEQGAMPVLGVGLWDRIVPATAFGTLLSGVTRADGAGGTGDSAFRNADAFVRIYGLWRPESRRVNPLNVTLLGLYPAEDPETKQKAVAIAWNVSSRGNSISGSARRSFVVPMDEQGQLQLALSTKANDVVPSKRRAASTGAAGMDGVRAIAADPSSVLTLGIARSPMALRQGVYFIALRQLDREDVPNWQALRVREFAATDSLTPNGEGFLRNADGSGVDFDYIALSIQAQTRVPKS